MALRNSRTTTETVPSKSLAFGLVERYVEKEDKSNFTVNEWRNKVFTDPRVRSKQKDLNYKVKVKEDVELTRIGAQKTLQQKYNFKLSDDPISVGRDAIIFSATYGEKMENSPGQQYTLGRMRMVVVKVWNRPGKELLESKKETYETDPSILEEVSNSTQSEFPSIWAAREMKFYEKLRSAGILCPTPIFCYKNILVTELEVAPLYVDLSTTYANIVKSMKILYTLGMVWTNIDESSLKNTGLIFDAGQVLPIAHPKALERLFQNCQNVYRFCGDNPSGARAKRPIPTPEETFSMVVGFEFTAPKTTPKIARNCETHEQEIDRKAERKSQRSLNAGKKLKNQEIEVK